MAGTLYTYPDNFRAYKILIAAKYSRVDVEVVSDTPEFELGKSNTTPEFLSKFPFGKVPAFETCSGVPIYESNAIAYYVSNNALRGETDLDAAHVQQYVSMADSEILPAACTWVFPTLGIMQFNQQALAQAQQAIRKVFSILDSILASKTFLVGERVTLADICVVCSLLLLYKQVLDPEFRKPYVNVNRYFVTCVNQPEFKEVFGDVTLCSVAAQFDAKKYNQLFPKEKKEKKEKKKAAPAAAKPAGEKPKQKKEEKEEEEEEDSAPKPPKFTDPYACLPPSSFVSDAFKRVYSNEDTATKAIPYFWENFDKAGWSLWKSTYKYKEDLPLVFMKSNLVSGMFQRLEKLRKTAFASVLILGENNDCNIEGVWVLRGQELAFDLVEDWNVDAPSFNFVKLDPDDEANRETVNKFFLWEGDFGGKEVADGKIFK